MLHVLGIRDFRLLWIGQATSLLGDQFAFIAMPWLVLQMTGDPLTLGIVLALAGIPRALFILIGGAITDRFAPRGVMLISDVLRLVLASLAALLILTGSIALWMVYAISLAFGMVAGFFIPAANSIVPTLVQDRELEAGNSIMGGSLQLASFVGPALAGGVIALVGNRALGASSSSTMVGIAAAFALDALTFLASVITLWWIHTGRDRRQGGDPIRVASVLASVGVGIRVMWEDPVLRLIFIVISLANLLFLGPMVVGIPYLAKTRLAGGAAAFGIVMSGYGGGNLLGILLAGTLPRPSGQRMRALLVTLVVAFGVGVAAFGWISSTWVAFVILFVLGVGNGYIYIVLYSQVQRRTPREMLGRIMSLVMFANFGLGPISQALAGAISRWSLTALFVGAGGLLVLVGAWVAWQPALRQVASEMVEGQTEGAREHM